MPTVDFPSPAIPAVAEVTGLESWPGHSPVEGLVGLKVDDIRKYIFGLAEILFADIPTTTFPADQDVIRTKGFSTPGRGGATYRRWIVGMTALDVAQQNYSWVVDATGVSWYLSQEAVSAYVFGATGGFATKAEAQAGPDDAVPLNKMFSYYTNNPSVCVSLANRYWKTSTGIQVRQNQNNRYANWLAGGIVAADGSSGDKLVVVSSRYSSWAGKLGAYGTGGSTFSTRTWNCGIYVEDSSRVDGQRWEAETFIEGGLVLAADLLVEGDSIQNNISCQFGMGRAVDIGNAFMATTTSYSVANFQLKTRSGTANSPTQESKLLMQSPLPTGCKVDTLVYIPFKPVVNTYVADGVTDRYKFDSKYSYNKPFFTVRVNGVIKTEGTHWEPVPKNHLEFKTAHIPTAGQTIEITIKVYEPHLVVAVDRPNNTIDVYPWVSPDYAIDEIAELAYGYGAGVKFEGGNTASISFGPIDCMRVGVGISAQGLYGVAVKSLQVQASAAAIQLGNGTGSATYGFSLDSFHCEGTIWDYIFCSTSEKRFDMPTFSAQGVRGAAHTRSALSQIFNIAPKDALGVPSTNLRRLTGVTLFDGLTKIPPRSGTVAASSSPTVELSPAPFKSRVVQKAANTTVKLQFEEQLDRLMGGYNYVEFSVFGTQTGGGPANPTTVTIEDFDLEDGFTVMGGSSVSIPASKYPIHGLALIDMSGASPGAKNWLLSWWNSRPSQLFTVDLLAQAVPANGNVVFDVPVSGFAIGDAVQVSHQRNLPNGLLCNWCWVNAATVRVTYYNITGAVINVTAGKLNVLVTGV